MQILKYILKRLLTLIPVLLGVTFFAFFLGQMAPGDPVEEVLMSIGIDMPTMEQLEEQREEMGLNDPIFVQYGRWIRDLSHGNLGKSYFRKTPIVEEFKIRLPITLKLSLFALVNTLVFGIGGGIIMAINQNKWWDKFLRSISILLLSIPGFVLAMAMIIIFSEHLKLLPTSRNGGFIHFIMPSIALSAGSMAMTSRVTRSSVISQITEQYIVFVRAKGLSEKRAIIKHGVINAMLPVITIIGNYWAAILGGSTIVESIFALNGLGSYLLTAINSRDHMVVQAYVLYISSIYVLITLLIDIIYLILDPKMRLEAE